MRASCTHAGVLLDRENSVEERLCAILGHGDACAPAIGPEQLPVVWTLTLQPESEGPNLISCAARLLQLTMLLVSFPRRRGAQSSA